MTDDAGGRDTPARPWLVVATDGPDLARGLELDTATVVAAGDPPGTWPDEAIAGLYLDLNSNLPQGLLARVFERAARPEAESVVLLGLRGRPGPLSPAVQTELETATHEWVVTAVRPAEGGVVVELRLVEDGGDTRQDGPGGPALIIAGIVDSLGPPAQLHEEVAWLGRRADAAEAQARRLRETCEQQRVEIVRLQDRLKAEWELRKSAQADVRQAQADLASAQQRVARIEQSRLGRMVRRSWRLRRQAARPVARIKRLAGLNRTS